jgi:hypothetical protein
MAAFSDILKHLAALTGHKKNACILEKTLSLTNEEQIHVLERESSADA